ncbi:MAG: type II secretion system F family protein, partial [Planctomycetota bacterium]
MPVFSYTALDKQQSVIKGTISGDSPRQARDSLRDIGLTIVDIQQDQHNQVSQKGFRVGRRNASYVGMFTGELATLLAVDIPLHDALNTLSQQYQGSFKKVVLLLKDEVDSGKQLATAMEKLPDVFDRLC